MKTNNNIKSQRFATSLSLSLAVLKCRMYPWRWGFRRMSENGEGMMGRRVDRRQRAEKGLSFAAFICILSLHHSAHLISHLSFYQIIKRGAQKIVFPAPFSLHISILFHNISLISFHSLLYSSLSLPHSISFIFIGF